MPAPRVAKLLAVACVGTLAMQLAFRGLFYSHLPIAPGEPYGISDLIELLLGSVLIAILVATALAALILGVQGPRPNRVAAGWLTLLVLAIAMLAGPAHDLAARLSST